MNDGIEFEIICPNNHGQTLAFSPRSFEAELKSGNLVFHCDTCNANWPPSQADIAKIRRELTKSPN